MPIAPTPLTFECPNCGWRKTTTPEANVLTPNDFFTCCPDCDNRDLFAKEATPCAVYFARLRKRWALWRLNKNNASTARDESHREQ